MKKGVYFVILLCFFFFQGFAQKKNAPYLILVSFDGFRYDYLNKYSFPHFQKFIQGGSKAESLIPSYPSKTFPNFYSIVTGLYPDHHGIVDNSFYSKEFKETYSIGNRKAVQDPKWYKGTPIWNLSQKQGVKSACYYWVGSEAPIQGLYPNYWYEYDSKVKNTERLNQVFEWLQLPEEERPHLITVYFSFLDELGHKYGTTSDSLLHGLKEADELIGILEKGLDSIKINANILIVSDHGMLDLKNEPQYFINIEEFADLKDSTINIVSSSFQSHLYIDNPAQKEKVYQELKKNQKHFHTFLREEVPDSLHYNSNPCIGDILLVSDPPYFIGTQKAMEKTMKNFSVGSHGYNAYEVKEMQGIFFAKGPSIRSGFVIPSFQNIHIYPLIAKILGLKTEGDIDGNLSVLKSLLRKEK